MSADFLREATRQWPDRRALSDMDRCWTYAELDAWVSEIAVRIRKEDAPGDGDVLAGVVDATPDGIAFLLAAFRAGVAVAPLHPQLTESECDIALRSLTGTRPGGSAVIWTSGSSARPRGVVLSAKGLRQSALASARRLELGPADRWLVSLPVAHVGGLALVTRTVLLGSEMVVVGRFDAKMAGALIDQGRVTHASLVPTQLLRLLDETGGEPPPPSFRCVLVGGARAGDDLLQRALDAGWPVALTYGMSEMTSQVATAPPQLVLECPGTVGVPLDGVEVRLTTDGEILTRGPTQAVGYLGASGPLADAGGWYATGDLGRLDEEGRLWITGRLSSRIVSGGVSVDPAEVEETLRGHPAVMDACVIGLEDAEWGEKVASAVVPVEGEFDLEVVDAYARERLMPAKRPRRWLLMDRLPLNVNGKVDRESVRRRFE
jgi:O-succinylbenzoic acid--CoA ligase